MPYGRCQLLDPAPGGLGAYDWQINYDEEEEFASSRGLTPITTTGGKVILQQGENEPLVWRFGGTILHANQHAQFQAYFAVAQQRTLIFTDFEGHQYEVLMTAYKPKRERVALNPRDPSIPLHIYRYTMELAVVRVISGPVPA